MSEVCATVILKWIVAASSCGGAAWLGGYWLVIALERVG
jgi:hypothetical protein